LKTSDYLGAVTFFREPAQGHFPEESIQRLRLLLPILKYALQTAVIVDRTKQLADLAVTNEAAVVLLNHKGRVIHANDRALQLERAGHLRGLHQAGVGFGPDRRQIGILINDAVQGRCGAARIDDGERLLDVQAVPMKPATQPLEPFHASAALILSDPQRPSPADAVALHDLFGLTPREQEIAQRLLAGQSTQSMSNQMRISPATTRVHLRSILQKTETHSQRELVALLSKYPRSL
jgi:DNA-binding CsgD family transcriptional regulator